MPAESSYAVLSEDGLYRYVLGRRWGGYPRVTWVMLNPSTADASVDDPTIRKCIGFSKRWGFGSLSVVNLFAYRATDPKALLTVDDPIGPDNPEHVRSEVESAGLVVAGWGQSKRPSFRIGPEVWAENMMCLGVTKAKRQPRHPLYVPYETPLMKWGS